MATNEGAKQDVEVHRIAYERQLHRMARYCAFPITIFAILLVLDELLPPKVYHEAVVVGWQERGPDRRHARRLYSYMQTESFSFLVPHQMHLNYPYYDDNKPPLKIDVTPIFSIPVHATFSTVDSVYSFALRGNIHTFFRPLGWMMIFSGLFTSLVKKYSKLTYSLAFLPLLLLAVCLLQLLT